MFIHKKKLFLLNLFLSFPSIRLTAENLTNNLEENFNKLEEYTPDNNKLKRDKKSIKTNSNLTLNREEKEVL